MVEQRRWNTADVPVDTFWSWGAGDSLIIVIPSLDLVIARAGQVANDADGNLAVSDPFSCTDCSVHPWAVNQAPVCRCQAIKRLHFPRVVWSSGSVLDDNLPNATLTSVWTQVSGQVLQASLMPTI